MYPGGLILEGDKQYGQFTTQLGLENKQEYSYLLFSYVCKAMEELEESGRLPNDINGISVEDFLLMNTFLPGDAYGERYLELEYKLRDWLCKIKE